MTLKALATFWEKGGGKCTSPQRTVSLETKP
jgi:hypothetical protein